MSRYPEAWTCATCGTVYVVPSMARACELKHELLEALDHEKESK